MLSCKFWDHVLHDLYVIQSDVVCYVEATVPLQFMVLYGIIQGIMSAITFVMASGALQKTQVRPAVATVLCLEGTCNTSADSHLATQVQHQAGCRQAT